MKKSKYRRILAFPLTGEPRRFEHKDLGGADVGRVKTEKTGKTAKTGRPRRARYGLALAAWVWLAGCAGQKSETNHQKKADNTSVTQTQKNPQDKLPVAVLKEHLHSTTPLPIPNHGFTYETLPNLTRQGLNYYYLILPDTVPYQNYSFDFFGKFQQGSVCDAIRSELRNITTDIIGIAIFKPSENMQHEISYVTFVDDEKLLSVLQKTTLQPLNWEKVARKEYPRLIVSGMEMQYFSYQDKKTKTESPTTVGKNSHKQLSEDKIQKLADQINIWRYQPEGSNYTLLLRKLRQSKRETALDQVLSDKRLSMAERQYIKTTFSSSRLVRDLVQYSTITAGQFFIEHKGIGIPMPGGLTAAYEDNGDVYILQTGLGDPMAGRLGRILVWRFIPSIKPDEQSYYYTDHNGDGRWKHSGPIRHQPECGVQIYYTNSTSNP